MFGNHRVFPEGLRVEVNEGAVQVRQELASPRKGFRAWSPEKTVGVTQVFQGSARLNSGSRGLDTEYTVCLETPWGEAGRMASGS